jgi:RimJ/RimL family protein N-acetyltransferase
VGLHRLYATVDDDNLRSLAAVAKADRVELLDVADDGEHLFRITAPGHSAG